MAYLREEKQKIEIDYPIEKVWDAIPEVAKIIEWTLEEKNDETHKAKLRTKKGFLSYNTVMNVEAVSVDEQTTRVSINAETPVTTITSMADFGRTRDRIELFIEGLAVQIDTNIQMEKEERKKKK
jgi:carbon monoxide dehydrogenase subunit G